ncbi:MAG TPA: Rv2993c-like domain-containing protein, partial [Desulfobacterales bacterium]|nr:Rv2993c-like domain-containing protein [Desulfobacterales bacterium]
MKPSVKRFVRYEHQGKTFYGILDGAVIAQVQGGLFGGGAETGVKIGLNEARLLWPCEPSKVLAVGLNYKSHLGDRPAPVRPELFWKPNSCLLEP